MRQLTYQTRASVPFLHDILAGAGERLVLALHHEDAPDTILCDIQLAQDDDLFENIHDLASREDVTDISVYQRVTPDSAPDVIIPTRTAPTHWRTVKLARNRFLDWLSDWFDASYHKHDDPVFLLVASVVANEDILALYLGHDVRYHVHSERALNDVERFLDAGGQLENVQCIAYREDHGIPSQQRLGLRPSRVAFVDPRGA